MAGLQHTLNSSADRNLPGAETEGQKSFMDKLNSVSFEFGPGRKDILNFTNQLSVMVRAGISLQEAIESIAGQVENNKFRVMLTDIKNEIESGQSFSQALGKYPDTFSNLYINMIAAAEISGSLSSMLEKLAGYLDQEAETRSQVIGAMVYPGIIATMAIGCTSFLMLFVLPRFLKIFEGKEHILPAPTKLAMYSSNFMRNYWYINLPVVIGAIVGFVFFVKTPTGKDFWHKAKLKIPLMKKLCTNLYITRGLHTMGVLSNSGVPILDTLMITASISGNIHYERMWRSVHDSVRQGKKIGNSLAEYNLMPTAVVQMIKSGEDSGTLGEVLKDIADFYGRELKATIKMVTSMIEPIMIVLMGAIVGFLAASIILPIFKMSSAVSS